MIDHLGELPRPPKDLRVVELWGVREQTLHQPDELEAAINQIVAEMGLHPIKEKKLEHGFTPHGLSYVRLLEESHITGHTYFEQNGHLDLQLSTCTEGLDLDPLAEITRRAFKPTSWGFCYRAGYPTMQIIDEDQLEPVRPISFHFGTQAWMIKPWGDNED